MALSMGQPPPGQENGVTGTGQQFGPARGEYHDTKQWAMTVSKATSREIVDNPPPTNRQRKAAEPAFLKASDGFDCDSLAALLMIYHSIPLAREALLLPNYQQLNYGYDPQWWTGHHIVAPTIVSLDEQGPQHNRDDVLIETQRLMAFLDGTNRAYASIDALADLQNYQGKEADSVTSRFLEAWHEGATIRSRDDPLTQVFNTRGIRQDPNNTMDKYFSSLEATVDPKANKAFTEILDGLIWGEDPSDPALYDVWFDEVGDVVTLRFSDPRRKQGKLGVKIPAVWYPDRYMNYLREPIRDMRVRKRNVSRELDRLERSRKHVLNCFSPNRQCTVDVKTVLSEAVERAPMVIKNGLQYGNDKRLPSSPSSTEVNECVKALQDLIVSIENKVEEWEKIEEELRAKLKATTAELTNPNAEEPLSPSHRYTLRGVSTKPHITYVLKPSFEEQTESEVDKSASKHWQWWRISVSTEGAGSKPSIPYGPNPQHAPSSEQGRVRDTSGPFSPWSASTAQNNQSSQQNGYVMAYDVRKVSEEHVLKAAEEEDDSITLVYASDQAVDFQGSPLSGPLQTFVKADNKMFENELRGVDLSQGLEFTTNGEEMAQLHFSPADNMQDVALDEDKGETLNGRRESSAPAVSSLSPRRGADGQPSPKRAKGDDEPPPYYEHNRSPPEMQERGGMGILGTVRPNRIGQHAEKMMDAIIDDAVDDEERDARLGPSRGG